MHKSKIAHVMKEINEFSCTVAPRALCIYSRCTGDIMLCHVSTVRKLGSDPRAASVALGLLLPVTVLLLIHIYQFVVQMY
jgi:hypothetical protein